MNTIQIKPNPHEIFVYRIMTDCAQLKVDGWGDCPWALLRTGDEYVDESYRGSQYVIDDDSHCGRMPINIRITGRTLQYGISSSRTPFVRCEIEFVKDGEENVFIKGYVEMEYDSEVFK